MKRIKLKTKTDKGIALIAIIIVVLLIIAIVAIKLTQNTAVTIWEQNGTAVIKKNTDGTITTLAVGDSVTVKIGNESAEAYSANGESNWKVLGAENGKLLLVTDTNVTNVALGSKEGGNSLEIQYVAGYNNGVEYLNGVCNEYLNSKYALEARSIKIEDLNRITGYKTIVGKICTYPNPYCSSFEHPTKGTASETNKITETSTICYYAINSNDIGKAAENLLCLDDGYWLASPYVDAYFNYATFGLHMVGLGYVLGHDMWSSLGGSNYGMSGVRVVVSLKPNVIVTKV